MSASSATGTRTPTASAGAARAYTIILGIAALVVLLQAVWAGLFIQEGQDYKDSWVKVHARGADLAILLMIIATVIAFVKFRERKDLVIGSGVMAVVLVVEAYIGGIIGDHSGLTVVHFPLGMALMGLAVWLPLRARSLTSRA